MQNRVDATYDPATRLATMSIAGTSIRVDFRPVNRKRRNHQKLRPGLFAQVGSSDFIPDSSVLFPATLCSTMDDSSSINAMGKQFHYLHKYMGIYAVV
ncbi:hypothetical protein ACOMHN_058541 [Nucella lapillus]